MGLGADSSDKKIVQSYDSEPIEKNIDTSEYILGAGDEIYLNIVTSNQIANYNLPISPNLQAPSKLSIMA